MLAERCIDMPPERSSTHLHPHNAVLLPGHRRNSTTICARSRATQVVVVAVIGVRQGCNGDSDCSIVLWWCENELLPRVMVLTVCHTTHCNAATATGRLRLPFSPSTAALLLQPLTGRVTPSPLISYTVAASSWLLML
jgi:hypothetical protein